MTLANPFIRNIVSLHGEAGRIWLAQLPAQISAYSQRWNLTIGPPFAGLSYNYVAPATRADGTAAVFKSGIPGSETLLGEIAALRHYAGGNIARLLEVDQDQGVLLIARVVPGTQLAHLEDDAQATHIAAGVMRSLWRPSLPTYPFPTAAHQALGMQRLRATFDGETGPFPTRLVETAETLFRDLLASSGPPMLLHADLHHYNILNAGGGSWWAIDPQGVIGEAEFEVGALLRNPILRIPTMPDLDRVMAHRVAILSDELGFTRERIVGWGLAQAVLSAWWSYEDFGETGEHWLRCANALAMLL